jgi:bifunctional UDP-N-acetylglucosamine pyrophosphorylase/glucosamine-1-phosphate N-acetyltransferase
MRVFFSPRSAADSKLYPTGPSIWRGKARAGKGETMKVSAVLLAAGQGTRMRSATPKVLHRLCGKPMVWHSLRAVRQASTERPVVIVGYGAAQVEQFVADAATCVLQEPQLGTAHAVLQAESVLKGQADLLLVSYADMPLLKAETYGRLVEAQRAHDGPISMLTVMAEDPRGFGRVVRDGAGKVRAVVEENVATHEELAIRELNVGAYCFKAEWLWEALHRIPKNPDKGEYYLTDIVGLAAGNGLPVQTVRLEDAAEAIGINTRVHLAEAEAVLRGRINEGHMLNGVTLADPATIYIEAEVAIGRDTVIMPNTHLLGGTTLGEGNEVGPNTIISNSRIGNRCKILASVLDGAVVEDDVDMGPFARLRRGAHLAAHVHMGNFGEVKDSYLGPGVKVGHFSYIGDARIGENTNIGAGTITCNFDGEKKNPTEIGEDVFIGSDTMLVAPVKIGRGAKTGAGAVVTKDVPADTLAVGMPARNIRKLERKSKKA